MLFILTGIKHHEYLHAAKKIAVWTLLFFLVLITTISTITWKASKDINHGSCVLKYQTQFLYLTTIKALLWLKKLTCKNSVSTLCLWQRERSYDYNLMVVPSMIMVIIYCLFMLFTRAISNQQMSQECLKHHDKPYKEETIQLILSQTPVLNLNC